MLRESGLSQSFFGLLCFQFLQNRSSRLLPEPLLVVASFAFFVHPTTTLSSQIFLSSNFCLALPLSCLRPVNINALMAMVMLAMLFLLRERRVHLVEVKMLSCQDIVELLNVFLPRRDLTPEAVIANIERRHRKRREAMEAARRSAEARYFNRHEPANGSDSVLTM